MKRTQHILAVLLGLACLAMAMADPFDGTKWKVKVVPDEDARQAGAKDFNDTLFFKASMFSTESFVKRGFKPVTFDEDTRRFGPATFTAEPESEKEGKAKWTGTVTAVTLRGDLVWTRKDGTVLRFSYQGERDDSK